MQNVDSHKSTGWHIKPEAFLFAVVLLAAFLRFYRLDDFPPALYWDEACDGYDAQRVAQTLTFPVFFEGNNGREPLMIDLRALGIILFGARAWTLRFASAIVGVVSIPVIYRLATELFKTEKRAQWLAALAAGMLAVSFWDLGLSRFSVRAISLPLFSMLTLWAFWRGWQSHRLFYFALSGALLGLTLYTHIPARLLPLVLIGFMIAVSALQLQHATSPTIDLRHAFVGLGVLFVMAIIAFAPLAMFFVHNPGAFTQRISTTLIVSSGSGEMLVKLGENVINIVRMLIDRGDMNPSHNIPGRPALELFTAIGFWIGLFIALRHYAAKPVYLLLLLWLGANLAMTILTTQAPHFHRALGALPPIAILAADGLTRMREHLLPRVGILPLVVIVIALGGAQTYNDYFNIWGPSRNTFYAFEGPTNVTIQRVLSLSQTSNVMLPLSLYVSPQMQFYLRERYPHSTPVMSRTPQGSAWFVTGPVQRTNIVLGKEGVFIPQPLDDTQIARLKVLVKSGTRIENEFGPLGTTELYLTNVSEFVGDTKPSHSVDAIFADQVRMFGYNIEPTTAKPGDQVFVTYYWQALQDLHSDYYVTTNLLDPSGESFAKRTSEPVLGKAPTSLWQRGTIIPDTFDIHIPLDAHDGQYHLEVGLLNLSISNLLVPLQGTTDRLYLDPITVAHAPVNLNAIPHPLDVTLGLPPSISLLGYNLNPNLHPGDTATLTFFWRAESLLPRDYSVFVHLLDSDGTMRAQQDGPPQNGNAPTSWWSPGDLFADAHLIQLPADLAWGKYTLELGVYDPSSGVRLPMFDAQGARRPNDQWQILIDVIAPR